MSRAARHAVLWVVLAIVAQVFAAPAAHAGNFTADDAHDAYVGTGGLILPVSAGEADRRRVASCLGCAWRLTTPCLGDGTGSEPGPGTAFSGSPACMSVSRGCPGGRHLLRSWFAPKPGAWEDIGVVCIGVPVTVQQVAQGARDSLRRSVPGLVPAAEPSHGAIAQIPVNFASGQDQGALEIDETLGGLPSHLEAAASWAWDFGDGTAMTARTPGCAFPCMSVTHAYLSAGGYRVRVAAHWEGRFWVDGLGPFAVGAPVVQEEALRIEVGEGRALLTVP